MNDNIIYLFLVFFGAAIGIYLGNRLNLLKSKSESIKLETEIKNKKDENLRLENKITSLLDDLESMRTEKDENKQKLTELTIGKLNLEEKLLEQKEEVTQLQNKFSKEFENLANKILDEKSEKFTKQNIKSLDLLLNPLQEKIASFEKKVELSQKESFGMHSALKQQIEGLEKLNQQMSKEATNLANALKGDSKVQGDWGEVQLEVILEKAGLSNGIHYSTQGGYRDENGNLKKPDFIINLPENKHLIIDSKVSLKAYEEYYSSENEEIKVEKIKKHILSIKKHIKELSEKQYTELYGINTPDYVLMFVPIEAALLIALNENKKLYLDAFDKNVVLVSTSTLLATLSTISSIWKQEEQKRNVMEIARQAGALYDKFEGFISDLMGIGKKLEAAKSDYSSAMNKLVEGRGNLINSVEKIKKLGIKTKKSLPESILKRSENI
jgi:DNA recombination protein RmuC